MMDSGRQFRVVRRFRWGGYLAAFGLIPVMLVYVALVCFYPEYSEGVLETAVVMGIMAFLAFLCAFPAWYFRLRVDDQGLWIRRLSGLDLWTWEDFRSGRIDQQSGTVNFVALDKPLWRRYVWPAHFEDHIELLEGCFQEWSPPPLQVPSRLSFAVGMSPLIVLDEKGIDVRDGSGESCYSWQDVRQIHIRRPSHFHLGCSEMTIELGEETLAWKEDRRGKRFWFGSVVVEGYLRKYVPEEAFTVRAASGPALSLEELDERDDAIEMLERGWPKFVRTTAVIGLSAAGCTWYGLWHAGFHFVGLLAGILVGLGLTSAFLHAGKHDIGEARRKAEQQRRDLLKAGDTDETSDQSTGSVSQ